MKLFDILNLFSNNTYYKIRNSKEEVIGEGLRMNLKFDLLAEEVCYAEAMDENVVYVVLK